MEGKDILNELNHLIREIIVEKAKRKKPREATPGRYLGAKRKRDRSPPRRGGDYGRRRSKSRDSYERRDRYRPASRSLDRDRGGRDDYDRGAPVRFRRERSRSRDRDEYGSRNYRRRDHEDDYFARDYEEDDRRFKRVKDSERRTRSRSRGRRDEGWNNRR